MKMGLFVDYLQQPLINREELKVSPGATGLIHQVRLYQAVIP
jgi:hypothetical protein